MIFEDNFTNDDEEISFSDNFDDENDDDEDMIS